MSELFDLNEIVMSFSVFSEFIFSFLVLLIVFLIKPLLGRGWLILAIFFYILAALFDVQSSHLYAHYIGRIYHDLQLRFIQHDSFYLYSDIVQPMVDGIALFSLLMFFFVYFNKNIFGVEKRNFLFTLQGRVTRLQYLIVVCIVLSIFKPIVLSIEPLMLYYFDHYYLSNYDMIPSAFAAFILFVIACIISWIVFSISVRRWHDCDKTGWLALLPFFPTVLYLGAVSGTQGHNRYGNDPLEVNPEPLK